MAGGTLDIWPLGLLHPGALTVNMAIEIEVVLEVDHGGEAGTVMHTIDGERWSRLDSRQAGSDLTAAVAFALAPEGGLRVRVERQAPYCSGIGGSSSYGIALALAVATLRGSDLSERRLVSLVRDLEARVIDAPTGEQDHWAAVRGGVLALHLEAGGNRLENLDVSRDWLADRTTVFFSGISHRSGMVNWQVIRRRLDGDRTTTGALAEIASAAQGCREGLLAGNEDLVREAMLREWAARRRLAPEVCPPELDRLVRTADEHGAAAVKACGAGGGGSLLIWHPPDARENIVSSLERASESGRMLAAGAATQGARLLGDA
jgi:D-glycero-alpha-D-manno-heptose-7-phosphate kinase